MLYNYALVTTSTHDGHPCNPFLFRKHVAFGDIVVKDVHALFKLRGNGQKLDIPYVASPITSKQAHNYSNCVQVTFAPKDLAGSLVETA